MQINGIDAKESFQKDFKKTPANVQEAATKAIDDLLKNPQPNKLRLHSLSGCFNPKILKIDVMPNKSWQITFEMDGSTAILRRLGTHKTIDRRP